jgi:hypothetical protein
LTGSYSIIVTVTDGISQPDQETVEIEVFEEGDNTKDSPYLSLQLIIIASMILGSIAVLRRTRKR